MNPRKQVQAKHIPTYAVLLLAAGRPEAGYVLARYYPDKVVTAKLDKMVRQGYISFGVSLWRPFLTDEGRELLEKLFKETYLGKKLKP